MGILDRLDLEITPEALHKMGFSQKLYSRDLDMRYNLECMSNIEKADMINENIYYEYRTREYYQIVVRYYPDSFAFKLYDCALGKYSRMEDLHRNHPIGYPKSDYDDSDRFGGDRQYNLSITCEGQPYTSITGQKLMCENLRDLESWVNLAKLISKKEISDEYECA